MLTKRPCKKRWKEGGNIKQQINDKLKEVIDPELGINVVDLGLVYNVKEKDGKVKILMTLTSPGCPLAGVIDEQVKEKVGEIKGVKKVELEITFEPLWTPDKMNEETRARLGML